MIFMDAKRTHTFAPEYRDKLGRLWCATCGLPEQNARAKVMHAVVPRARDWRERAYCRDSDDK